VLERRSPDFVLENAVSPEGRPLTYRFELYRVLAANQLDLLATSEVPEGRLTTTWPAPALLDDGPHAWRARASDGVLVGPWTATVRFEVRLDAPPGPPGGLRAVGADAAVGLTWDPSPEPDVVAYRLYRSTASDGPYAAVVTTSAPRHVDAGLTNGTTYYYVVTALDARFESGFSAPASATPQAPPPSVLPAEIRLSPASVGAECLLSQRCGDREDCPSWLVVRIELPAGHDPRRIDAGGVRLAGSIRPDAHYARVTDGDHDRLLELELRFPFASLLPRLAPGTNPLTVGGAAAGLEFRGSADFVVLPLEVDLRITPRTLSSRSGNWVQARLTFPGGLRASEVAVASIRLNEAVAVAHVVESRGDSLTVKFDRAAVLAVLPRGHSVEVRVGGTVRGLPFLGRDAIRVEGSKR
jgi:hypothetical protein